LEFVSQFKDLFNKNVLAKDDVHIVNNMATLKEIKQTPVHIVDIDNRSAILVRFGRSVGQLPALREEYSKICDYMLLTLSKNALHVVFIELKRTMRAEDKPYEQLLRSRPLLDYFLSVHAVEYGRKMKPVLKPRIRYILIYQKLSERLDKQSVRPVLLQRKSRKYKSIIVRQLLGSYFEFTDLIQQ